MYYNRDPSIIQHGKYKTYNGINNVFKSKEKNKNKNKLKQAEINLTQPTPIMYITI